MAPDMHGVGGVRSLCLRARLRHDGRRKPGRPVIRAKDKVAPRWCTYGRSRKCSRAAKKRKCWPWAAASSSVPTVMSSPTNTSPAESSSVQCVLSDHREVGAKVVGVDPDTDIAVLKLDTAEKLPWVKMGRSSKLQAGQTVLALGSPHGLARSVSRASSASPTATWPPKAPWNRPTMTGFRPTPPSTPANQWRTARKPAGRGRRR